MPTLDPAQLKADLETIRKARIFFSHHSVGENILQGISRVAGDIGAPVPQIVALEKAAATAGPALLHGTGGRNKDPESKIAFFEATLRGSAQSRPQLAFMKFCYVDFNPDTDVETLFSRYRRAMSGLKREYPGVRFAHVTVPLVPRQTSLKPRLRRLLGMQEWTDASNAKRHQFNRKLKQAFPADPVFDLAGVESTAPDGSRVAFEVGGHPIPSMAEAYNADNGHLNALGQRVAGAAAIHFMAAALGGEARPSATASAKAN